ncbi:MAG TPA: HD-GYP domain-containing protein [Acidimicrobiia bacterium]|nr:HD-GYP domain-containing protein [Acidimicrobiia bacterium]
MEETYFSLVHLFAGVDGSQQVTPDDGTAQHSARVGQGSAVVAAHLGIAAHEVETVAWAGTLHDIGKLRIPYEVLAKPGPLTVEEWTMVKQHPVFGADMLLAVSPELEPIACGIRTHHEHWDGSGYPFGLRGDEIPVAGRIVAVLDVFDSLMCPRPYRFRVWSEQAVVDHIAAIAGTHLDPDVVAVFLELHEQGVAARRAG